MPHDRDGERQYLRRSGKEKVVLEGWEVSKEQYADVMNQALHIDDRLPEKTANGPVWEADET